MGDDVRLKELVSSLKSSEGDLEAAVEGSLSYIQQEGGGARAHSYLCSALLERDGVGGTACSRLLHCLGPTHTLLAVHTNTPRVTLSAVRWLAGELAGVLDCKTLSSILYRERCSSSLSVDQQQLLLALTRLPDTITNRLGGSTPQSLFPDPLFSLLGSALLACLQSTLSDLRGGQDRSLVFLAAVLSKSALLGHAKTVLSQIVPTMQLKCLHDPLWGRVSRSLFCRVSNSSMEPLLYELVQLVTPSLDKPHPLYLLLGDLAKTNQKARLVLTHKLWLTRLPGNRNAAYNLIGYLMSWGAGQELLGRTLQSVVGVWSDGGCVRRMDSCQHLWVCQLLVLGTNCLAPPLTTPTSSALREGVLRGLQVHLDSPVPGVRERGMTAGQCLMNSLHSLPSQQLLHFDLPDTEDTQAILQLARPVAEQQQNLEKMAPPTPPLSGVEGESEKSSEKMVTVTEASDTDSDDGLEPFDMSHNPDHTQPHPPCYLRDCLSVLVSPTERASVEVVLSRVRSLVLLAPPDLSEVCVDLARALLHLQDSWDIPSFPSLRHSALVALTTTRPRLLAPFLVTEFYSPNHNLRQRLDILEVISSAATELSSPSTNVTPSPATPSPAHPHSKPWRQIVEERVRAKTRVISKGPTRPPPPATPSRFSPVATLFFFPLLAPFDKPHPSLDLFGRDSLLLGHLVRVLGNVVWCACHAPNQPVMGRTLLEFLWSLRYHPSSFVRQCVLCALNMAVVATPTNYLLSDMSEALLEAMLWVQDVCVNDGDEEVRELAAQALSLLATLTGKPISDQL